MAQFVLDLGPNPDELQSGENTAFSNYWYYEGIANEAADTPLNGTYLNRGPKLVMASLRAFAESVVAFLNTPFVTAQYGDKSVTYAKLDDNLRTMLAAGGGGGATTGTSLVYEIDDIRSRSSAPIASFTEIK